VFIAICSKEPILVPNSKAIAGRIAGYLELMRAGDIKSKEEGRIELSGGDRVEANLGVPVRSEPASVSVVYSDGPMGDPEEAEEDWARELSVRNLAIFVDDASPDGVDFNSPAWPVIKHLWGDCDLIWLYCGV
jgi:hypothetical protein